MFLIGYALTSPTIDPLPEDRTIDPLPEDESPANWFTPDKEGYYHIGDLRYDENQFKMFYGTKEEKEALRNAIPGDNYRWPNGEVPYTFSNAVTEENRQKIKNCLNDHFNSNFEGCLNIR